MGLSSGTRLGVYEILTLIGAGGMGEVYRARDPRLSRDVALKILPPAFTADPERLRRFEQEARAAAALNHPNILAVFDIGTHDGAPYIVSELLEGETLRERLAPARQGREPLPVRKAIESAVQIAHGLAAAHDKGILHRDLKPDNIFVTTDGRVKILDFGLAKLTQSEAAFAEVSALPTTPPLTHPGVVLGTVGYMSPEQVRGLAADPRSDLFALGTILYEMLSGRRAFAGDTAMDAMTAILKEDPPDLPLGERRIPAALGRIVDRCLEKSPAARFQTASDLAFALDALSSPSGATQAIGGAAVTPQRRDRLAWALVTVFGVVAVAALAWATLTSVGRAPSDVRTLRFSIFPPDGWRLSLANRGGAPTPLVLSPDGRRLAFVVRRAEGEDAIWVRALDALTAQPLAGTEGASSIFWSPDSRFLGFFVGSKLKTIDAAGGPPTTLCELPVAGAGGTWSRDGVILFAAGTAPLQKVSASGGVPAAATTLGKGESAHFRPWFLPDGRHFLYSVFGLGSQASTLPIFVGSLDSTERVRLVESSSTNAVYAQGHLLFLRDTTLTAQPFDLRRRALAGDAFPVAEQIQLQGIQPPQGIFSVSDGGVLVYQTGRAATATGQQLTWFDRTGQPLATVGDRMSYGDVALSPDERRAVVSVGPPGDLWTLDLARGLPTRFTFNQQVNVFPIWSPDGRHIAFASIGGEGLDIYQKASNGVGAQESLIAGGPFKTPSDWSPDGRFLLYTRAGTDRVNTDVWVLPLVGDKKPFPLLATAFNESGAKFSPDGRWVAYTSDESGRVEVYVAPFIVPTGSAAAPGTTSGKWQVSTRGGSLPTWRRDGKEIFYVEAVSSRLIAISVNGQGPAFDVGAAQPLFTLRQGGSATAQFGPVARSFFDVTRDGRRFLVNATPTEAQAGPPPPITLVLNWTAALKK
jgi:eukaryotic-like serine/threonine-protein kinase